MPVNYYTPARIDCYSFKKYIAILFGILKSSNVASKYSKQVKYKEKTESVYVFIS